MPKKLSEQMRAWIHQQHMSTQTPNQARWQYLVLDLAELVETLEPEDTDASIRKLREERDKAEYGIAEALRVAGRRGTQHTLAKVEILGLREELAEAKAEIVKAQDFWAMYQQSDQTVGDMFSEINADAALGRLVRGMEIGTRLCREQSPIDGTPGWSSRMLRRGLWALVKVSLDDDDPAEALRSIQASEKEET